MTRQQAPSGEFIHLPLKVLARVAPLSGKTFLVFMSIWWLSAVRRTKTVEITGSVMNKFKLTRWQVYSGIDQLERERVIEVLARRRRKCITVRLLVIA